MTGKLHPGTQTPRLAQIRSIDVTATEVGRVRKAPLFVEELLGEGESVFDPL